MRIPSTTNLATSGGSSTEPAPVATAAIGRLMNASEARVSGNAHSRHFANKEEDNALSPSNHGTVFRESELDNTVGSE
jgi:hypothetical protein